MVLTTSAVLDIPGESVKLEKAEMTKLRKSFFPVLVLLDCLNSVCPQGTSQKASDPPHNPLQSEPEMFQAFVNKLAHVLDFVTKGDTVTALAVINHNGRLCYVFASNRRATGAMNNARAGLTAILEMLKTNIESNMQDSNEVMEERLLRKVLELNTVRVRSYLTSLAKELPACLKRCDGSPEGATSTSGLKEPKLTIAGTEAKEGLQRLSATVPDSNVNGQKSESCKSYSCRMNLSQRTNTCMNATRHHCHNQVHQDHPRGTRLQYPSLHRCPRS